MSYDIVLVLLSLGLVQLHVPSDAASIFDKGDPDINCGYQTCPRTYPDKLNIHLVAHTHDDVGWLKTVDQYYFGSRSRIQKAGVQYILDSVIQALLRDETRRFIYVETAFLWKWWLRQSPKVQEDTRYLINQGRLEIVGGAWSMNDEATTHYHSIIDQFTWGFRRLKDTFGECARPRVGWQIDPFGHSREQASLFAQMGFDGMLFGRMDYQDKAKRLENKTMEFLWKASPSLGKSADLFTAAMFNTYSPPPGFCFDVLCDDEPIIDDLESPDYNVDEKIGSFLKYAVEQASHFRTNNIILTMGGDFTYQDAEMYYANLDKLISYTNERNGSTVNIFYSTPSCYLKSLNDDSKVVWPTMTEDFFPYASDPHAFWTGYFTSRPTVKFFERQGNNLLQASKQLVALVDLKNHTAELEHFREAMGIMQHHDAVTGTEKQLVAQDYSRILYTSIHNAEGIISKSLSKWEKNGSHVLEAPPKVDKYFCLDLNISSCVHSERNERFTVQLYNPLSWPVSTYVRLPIKRATYTVVNVDDDYNVTTQMVQIPTSVLNIAGRVSRARNELIFRAKVPPLGYSTFNVSQDEFSEQSPENGSPASFIENDLYKVSINDAGHIVVNYKKEKNMTFVQSFHYYEGAEGDNREFINRSSGAYIFRPKDTTLHDFTYSGTYQIFKGPLVQEIHQTVNKWISQVVRIYNQEQRVEFDWLVGSIPVEDKIGKEIITKYSSNLQSKDIFYTDSNGREMLKRVRNQRPTWNLHLEEPISGNYYPVTTKISLKDEEEKLKLSVLTDRAQGGSSMKNGELELMLHRRLLRDDAFGVGEALNETAFGEGLVVRGTHYLIGGSLENLDQFTLKEKQQTFELSLRPIILFSAEFEKPLNNIHSNLVDPLLRQSALAKNLPPNVHILTLEPWKNDSILLRLEHIFEVGEALQLSKPVEVNIQDLFSLFTIRYIDETTLGGNQLLQDSVRLHWNVNTNEVLTDHHNNNVEPIRIQDDNLNVLLQPMEIRTFIIHLDSRRLF